MSPPVAAELNHTDATPREIGNDIIGPNAPPHVKDNTACRRRQGIQLRRHHHAHEILLAAQNTCLCPKGSVAKGGAWKVENQRSPSWPNVLTATNVNGVSSSAKLKSSIGNA